MVWNDVSTSRQWLSVNCADWLLKMPIIIIIDSFDVHYSKICCKLQERYICRFVFFCIGCILIDVVRCSTTTSWNFWIISEIFYEIFQGKKSRNFTSLTAIQLAWSGPCNSICGANEGMMKKDMGGLAFVVLAYHSHDDDNNNIFRDRIIPEVFPTAICCTVLMGNRARSVISTHIWIKSNHSIC